MRVGVFVGVDHILQNVCKVGYRIVNVTKNIVKYITGNYICMVNALIHTLICTEVNCLFASVYLQLSCADIHTNMMILYTQ